MPRKADTPKKVYDLPGQRRDPPPELDSLRMFYSSLYREKGIRSRMATTWMLEHGLLPVKLARKLDAGIWDPGRLKDVMPKFSFRPAKPMPKFSFRPAKPNSAPAKPVKFSFKLKAAGVMQSDKSAKDP